MVSMWEYHNIYDLSGDPRWASASPWTRRAPFVVFAMFLLSILETVLGAVWIAQLKSDTTVYVPLMATLQVQEEADRRLQS